MVPLSGSLRSITGGVRSGGPPVGGMGVAHDPSVTIRIRNRSPWSILAGCLRITGSIEFKWGGEYSKNRGSLWRISTPQRLRKGSFQKDHITKCAVEMLSYSLLKHRKLNPTHNLTESHESTFGY